MLFPQQNIAGRTEAPAIRARLRATLSIALSGLLLAGTAFAAGPSDDNAAQPAAQYQRDKAACTSGRSNESKATCLREAGAAYEQARQGKLNAGTQAQYRQNALTRCKALPAQDQEDCRRRMENPADVEGSAASGGILRKDVTIVPENTQ